MSLEFEAGSAIEWEPGPYEGHLLKMEKRFKQFTKTEEDGTETKEDRSFYIWHFAVDEEGFENVTLTAVSGTSFGPKAKAREWAEAILRRKLDGGERFTEEDLKGRPVILNITLKDTDRGTFAEIKSLTSVRSKKSASKQSPEEQVQEVEDHLDQQAS